MTDQEILERIGLTPEELREFFSKFNQFANSLKPGERELLIDSLKPAHVAAAEASRLHSDITPDRLETLMKTFAPPNGIPCFCCSCLHKHKHRPPKSEE